MAAGQSADIGTERLVVSGAAGRYAVALFELALSDKALDAVAADLQAITSMLEKSEDFQRFVTSPAMRRGDQSKALLALLKDSGAHNLTKNFLGVIAKNGRLSQLPEIIIAYGKLVSHHRGEMTAEVASAAALTDTQLSALKAKLKVVAGRDVNLAPSVDPSILGGLVVKLGSRMIDSSLKTKLNNLQTAMKEVQ